MEKFVLDTIKKYKLINSNDKIVIGVSGGPDSMCLLNIMKNIKNKLNFEICVAHINHMIREEASEDEKYVQEYCRKNNIDFFVKHFDVIKYAKQNKIGTEEAGRNVRYKFFNEILENTESNKIAIAHNANDNAETVLMNLMRGSGISGLKGIEPIRANIIRPLIDCTREQIEEYCSENKLEPRIDKTNKENKYTRNKIRNLLIPYIKENFNPNIVIGLNRLSKIASEESSYFEKITFDTYSYLVESESKNMIELNLKKFNSLDTVIKKKILLYTINKLRGTHQGIEKIHMEDIIKLCSNNIGNKFLIPNKNLKVLIKNHKILFILLN